MVVRDEQREGAEFETVRNNVEPIDPGRVTVTLEPWGELELGAGQFSSQADCTAHLRSSGSHSYYTSPERCDAITDPIFCSAWHDENASDAIGCHIGIGGCEIDLSRHDLRAEAGTRTVMIRCEPFSLDDAIARHIAYDRAAHGVPPE